MPRANINVRIKNSSEVHVSEERFRARRRGEILHLALSFVRSVDDVSHLNTHVIQAMAIMGEKPSRWNLENDFIRPLKRVFSLPEVEKLFSPKAKEVLNERSILLPSKGDDGGRVLRPDRMVLFDDRVLVVDFKSEIPGDAGAYDEYRRQVKAYTKVVRLLFSLPAEGYLLFIVTPKAEKVC